MKFIFYIVLALSIPRICVAQEDSLLSLQDCIDIAIAQNLDLERAAFASSRNEVAFLQSKNALLPSLNGNYNTGVTTGRSIDPFTNDFINEQLNFTNAGLRLDATIFNGFRLINTWKQSKLNLQAAAFDVAAVRQEIILNVTLAYLQVLNNKDLLELAKAREATTLEQLNRLASRFEQGSGNPAEYRDLQGQIANDLEFVLQSENNLYTAKIDLNTLMNRPSNAALKLQSIITEQALEGKTAEDIYQKAMETLPNIKAQELRVLVAKKGVDIVRSQYLPELSFFTSLNTNYSSAAQIFNETGTNTITTSDFVTVNGTDFSVMRPQTQFESERISFADQFENNFNSVIGLSLNVPLFNGFRAKNNVALEKINTKEQMVILEQLKLNLSQVIEQAYISMETAQGRITILENQVMAYEESFRINSVQFDNGVSNSTAYLVSKNNLDNARINLANVTYTYAFRMKILEYYQNGLQL